MTTARDRLAELAADETASVYAAPRGMPTAATATRRVDELAAADAIAAPQRREALLQACQQTHFLDEPRSSLRPLIAPDHHNGQVLDFPDRRSA